MTRLYFAVLLVAAAVGPAPNSALGQDLTGQKIERAVGKVIAPELKKAGHSAVTLKPIMWAKTGKPAAAGAGLSQALAESLAAHGIGLTTGTQAVLDGTLARVVDEEAKPPAPALKLVLALTVDGKPVAEVPLLILMEGVIRVEPVDVAVPPKATPEERVALLAKALDAPPPPPPPEKATVKWSPDGTVGIEMLLATPADGKEAKAFAARPLDAKHRVKTAVGESARFRLINKNPFAVAGELRVAGVSWDQFAADADAEAEPADGKEKPEKPAKPPAAKPSLMVAVPANGEVVVRGWYRTDDSSLTFDVKALPGTAAGKQADVGVVSFAYRAGWKKGETPPAGDDDSLSDHQLVPGGVQKDKFERMPLIVGKFRGMVKLEYGEFKDKE